MISSMSLSWQARQWIKNDCVDLFMVSTASQVCAKAYVQSRIGLSSLTFSSKMLYEIYGARRIRGFSRGAIILKGLRFLMEMIMGLSKLSGLQYGYLMILFLKGLYTFVHHTRFLHTCFSSSERLIKILFIEST